MDDPLVELKLSDALKLLAVLKEKIPHSIVAFYYLETMLKWKKMDPSYDVHMFTLNGDVESGSLVMYNTEKSGMLDAVFYVPDQENLVTLEKALHETKKFPWGTMRFKFIGLHLETSKIVQRILRMKSSELSTLEDLIMWLPWQEAANIQYEVPEGLEVRNLGIEHAELINEIWSYNYEGSCKEIEDNISKNFGLGLFLGDKLVSWAIYFFYGGIGAVQTVRGERRKGYARIVVSAIVKSLGEQKKDAFVSILGDNKGSKAFFGAIGFKRSFEGSMIMMDI